MKQSVAKQSVGRQSVESYSSESAPISTVRRFFVANGKRLVVIVVIMVAALTGWRYWQHYQNSALQQAALSWQQTSDALSAGKAGAVLAAEQFAASNKNYYGLLASLHLARYFVDHREFDSAEQQLRRASGQTEESNLLSLIRLRLARVQLQQKKPDEALKTLSAADQAGWEAMAQGIRGDALLSQGNTDGARAAYSNAISAATDEKLNTLLQMKLDNLPGQKLSDQKLSGQKLSGQKD